MRRIVGISRETVGRLESPSSNAVHNTRQSGKQGNENKVFLIRKTADGWKNYYMDRFAFNHLISVMTPVQLCPVYVL